MDRRAKELKQHIACESDGNTILEIHEWKLSRASLPRFLFLDTLTPSPNLPYYFIYVQTKLCLSKTEDKKNKKYCLNKKNVVDLQDNKEWKNVFW